MSDDGVERVRLDGVGMPHDRLGVLSLSNGETDAHLGILSRQFVCWPMSLRSVRGQRSKCRVPGFAFLIPIPTSYICDNLRNLRLKRIGIERVGILPQITQMAQISIQSDLCDLCGLL